MNPTKQVSKGESTFVIDLVEPSSNQALELTMAITHHVSYKDISSIDLILELEIPEDLINFILTSIFESVSSLHNSKKNSDLFLDNFRDKVLKEVYYLSNYMNTLFMNIYSLKKDQDAQL